VIKEEKSGPGKPQRKYVCRYSEDEEPATRAPIQTAVTEFFPPTEGIDEGINAAATPDWEEVYPSPELAKEGINQEPKDIQEWLDLLSARLVNVPGNGNCMYYALYATKARHLRGTNMRMCATHNDEAEFYKNNVLETLLEKMTNMEEDGTLSIKDLYQRYFEEGALADHAEMKAKIQAKIKALIKTKVEVVVPRACWAGEDELLAAVWFFREPLYVINVGQNGSSLICQFALEKHNDREMAKMRFLTTQEATNVFQAYMRNRVIPLVIVLQHAQAGGHFQCARLQERFYVDWNETRPEMANMCARMAQVYAEAGLYQPPQVEPIRNRSEELDDAWEEDGQAERLTLPSPSPVSLNPEEYSVLMQTLNPHGRFRTDQAVVWGKVEDSNNLVAEKQTLQSVDLSTPPDINITVTSMCRSCGWNHQRTLTMLTQLPYPEAAVAILPEDLVQRNGLSLLQSWNGQNILPMLQNEVAIALADMQQAAPKGQRTPPQQSTTPILRLLLCVTAMNMASIALSTLAKQIQWISDHQDQIIVALHQVSQHDWTGVRRLARSINSDLSTQSTSTDVIESHE
jgi:hypothetical protein